MLDAARSMLRAFSISSLASMILHTNSASHFMPAFPRSALHTAHHPLLAHASCSRSPAPASAATALLNRRSPGRGNVPRPSIARPGVTIPAWSELAGIQTKHAHAPSCRDLTAAPSSVACAAARCWRRSLARWRRCYLCGYSTFRF